jgi:CheY-like chemotaxis protein
MVTYQLSANKSTNKSDKFYLFALKAISRNLFMHKIECVLLVDDDFASNYLTEMIIQDMNFTSQIYSVRDGKAALEFMQEHCQPAREKYIHRCPDLILLDINMPVMDGFEFLDAYEKLQINRKEPILIILLTTSTNLRDVERAKRYKVTGYLEKPLSDEKLKKVLAQYNIDGLTG